MSYVKCPKEFLTYGKYYKIVSYYHLQSKWYVEDVHEIGVVTFRTSRDVYKVSIKII